MTQIYTTTETDLVALPNSDMATFSPETIARAGELLGCPLDEQSILKALIIQRDTGLSLARGELSVVPFGGKPTVFVNKQGYLAYAARHPQYEGYKWGVETIDGVMHAWCKVYRSDRKLPIYDDAWADEENKSSSKWKEMPRRMLAKVAIKRAHQAAFPMLNGLLMPEEVGLEDGPQRIARRDSDLTVRPESAPAPQAKTEPEMKPKPMPAHTYNTREAESVRQNMKERGMDISIFDKTHIPTAYYDGILWDADVISADFKRQTEAQVQAAKAKQEPEKPAPTPAPVPEQAQQVQKQELKTPTPEPEVRLCACGNLQMTDEEYDTLANSAAAVGIQVAPPADICKECAKVWWKENISKDITEQTFKCSECGKGVLPREAEESRKRFGVVLCPGCYKARLEAAAAAAKKAAGPTCAKCGKALNSAEVSASALFGHKDQPLCNKCLNSLAGGA